MQPHWTATQSVRPRDRRLGTWAGLAVLVALGMGRPAGAWAQPGAQPPPPVKAARVELRKVAGGQSFVGTVTPSRRAVIGSAVAGRIVEFHCNEGDYVEKGQVLAQVLTGTIEIELAQANADLKMAEAELSESVRAFPAEKQQADARVAAARARMEHASAKFRRVQALRMKNNASDEAVDEAQAAAVEAEAAHDEAEAARKMVFDGAREQKIRHLEAKVKARKEAVNFLEDRLSKYTIKAYFSGYVTAENTEVGHWIKEGEPVVEIAELDQVDVRVAVPEDQITDLEVGLPVRVEVAATRQKSFVGEIAAIVPQADLRARTFPVLVRLKNPRRNATAVTGKHAENHDLKSGMLARAILPVGRQKEGLVVSKDAIVLGGKSPMVYVIDTDSTGSGRGTVRPVPVDLGVAEGGDIQISGLGKEGEIRAGSLVVVEGNERLRPGQPVAFEERPGEPTEKPAGGN